MSDIDLADYGYQPAGAEEGSDADPLLVTSHSAYWRRTNRDGTYTQVTSTWGARCTDWPDSAPVGPFGASRVIEVINFRDLEDIGGTEIHSDNGYTDLGVFHSTVEGADTDARLQLGDEKRTAQLRDFPSHLAERLQDR